MNILTPTIRWVWSALRPEYNIVEGIRRTHACNDITAASYKLYYTLYVNIKQKL